MVASVVTEEDLPLNVGVMRRRLGHRSAIGFMYARSAVQVGRSEIPVAAPALLRAAFILSVTA
jgi:hypothetical protein